MRTVELLREPTHHLRSRRVGQSFEFLQVFVEKLARAGALDRCADEQGPLDRGGYRDEMS